MIKMKTLVKSTDKRHFIETNRDNPIIKNALNNKTTITKEIENFYGARFKDCWLESANIKKFDPEKSEKVPSKLLEIINPFSEQGKLNPAFLAYESVRNQFKKEDRYHTLNLPAIFASGGGIIGCVMGASAVAANMINANRYSNVKELLIISAGVGLAGILSLIKLRKNANKIQKTPDNIELNRLYTSILSIDNFIRKYKTYEELKWKH